VLGGSRRRLGGIGLGYLFLGASHFKYHVGAAAKLVLAAWASTPAASPCSSAWTPQRPGPGTPGPGSGRPRRERPGLPLLVTAQAGHGQDGGRDMVLSAGAALPEMGRRPQRLVSNRSVHVPRRGRRSVAGSPTRWRYPCCRTPSGRTPGSGVCRREGPLFDRAGKSVAVDLRAHETGAGCRWLQSPVGDECARRLDLLVELGLSLKVCLVAARGIGVCPHEHQILHLGNLSPRQEAPIAQ
jgi:hypothetical protein